MYVTVVFLVCCILCFFFFKQKTAYEMRISDWSSDVCSSDLQHQRARLARAVGRGELGQPLQQRQAERGGLAGAGLGAAQQVMAGERQRDGFELDRGRRGVAVFGQRAQQCGRKPECFERHWICCSWKSTPAGNESTHGARAPGREDRWFARSYP